MQMTKSAKGPSDRIINRLIVASILVLAIGIPLIGALYFFDQFRDPGPSMAERAIQSAEKAVRETPNSVTARFALAELYAAGSRYDEAISQYDEILKAAPDTAAVLIGRGRAYAARQQPDKAAADFQQVIDDKKGTEMAATDRQLQAAYFELGSLELQRGDATKAAGLLSQAVAISSTDADALFMLGKALTATGDTKNAIDAIRLSVALVPTGWCEPYAALSAAYTAAKDAAGATWADGMNAMCAGRTDEARTTLTKATTGAYALDAYVGLGLLAEGTGERDAAVAAYTKALEKDPKNFAATTGLGRMSNPDPAASAPASSPAPAGTAPAAAGGE